MARGFGAVMALGLFLGGAAAQSNGGTGSGAMSPSSSSPAGGGLNRPQTPGASTGIGDTPIEGAGATGNGGVMNSMGGTGASVQGPAGQGNNGRGTGSGAGQDPVLAK